MSRKRARVEIAVTAGLLAGVVSGCAYVEPHPWPVAVHGSGTPIPEGVDYVRAIQCGGLLWALEAAENRRWGTHGLASMTGLYVEWAEQLAAQAGQDPSLARPDMAASRDNIIQSTGGVSPASKAQEISQTYAGDLKSCSAQAEAADYDIVVIGG